MSFMYLQLATDEDGKVRANVLDSGELKFRSLGGANSRSSFGPFAVFQIESFHGLSFIESDQLLDILLQRWSTEELLTRLSRQLSGTELLEMLRERLGVE